jgi:hypothetical protein
MKKHFKRLHKIEKENLKNLDFCKYHERERRIFHKELRKRGKFELNFWLKAKRMSSLIKSKQKRVESQQLNRVKIQ